MMPQATKLSPPWQVRNHFLGIYIHYPYCVVKCDYCDFYSEGIGFGPSNTDDVLFRAYEKEIEKRIQDFPDLLQQQVDTIFFGGGTPSKASPKHLEALLRFLRETFALTTDCELSLECNPEDLTLENLQIWRELGFSRVNVGVQSRSAEALSYLGRYYDKTRYEALPDLLRNSPIPRMGIDLMYGVPGCASNQFWEDLQAFLPLDLSHLSLYSLTVEKGTPYSRSVKEKTKLPPEEETQVDILEKLPTYLSSYGYQWYEVSNYAKPNQESRHNLRYWLYEPYLGLGPGAHGFLQGKRYANPRNVGLYQKNFGSTKYEKADPKTELPLSLFRLFSPIALEGFFQKHLDTTTTNQYLEKVHSWKQRGLCTWESGIFQWNPSALLMLDDLILESLG